MVRKILFVINPNAGKKKYEEVTALIRKGFPQNVYYQIIIWKNKDDFAAIAERLLEDGYTDAVAVGGDGTVNQVAATIVGTDIRLGVIPAGSGNGLARTLGISMNPASALKQIIECESVSIDYGKVNGQPFFCTSGVGLDAQIGHVFSKATKRGLSTYAKLTLRELVRYKPRRYEIRLGNTVRQYRAMLVTVANAGQYGNDFYIAPEADLHDGLFHIAVLKPVNAFFLPGLLFNILLRRSHKSRYVEMLTAHSVTIIPEEEARLHYDGEPGNGGKYMEFENVSEGLRVIVGRGYKGLDE
jgi:diacylglycerol kinase (ATP)